MEKKTNIKLKVSNMTCTGCEGRIERKLLSLPGVTFVQGDYSKGEVKVSFDSDKINLSKIKGAINSMDYLVLQTNSASPSVAVDRSFKPKQLIFIVMIVFGAYMLINYFGGFTFFNYFPQAEAGMGYAALFVVGLLTSVHCIGMCGGICMTQCVPQGENSGETAGNTKASKIRPSLLYNTGRVISYTVIGGIVGALGSVISFSGVAKGIVAIFAGVFMMIMGLNMLNLFPWLRKFNLKMPKFLTRNITGKGNSPFYVGLLNGLMPCGPLQAMQLYALSTGSPVKGAISMLLFSLGTVPLMFGFGAVSSLLSKKFTKKMLTVSASLVIILGFGMLSTGMGLSGLGFFTQSTSNATEKSNIVVKDGVQTVAIDITSRSYAPITVKKGVPVKWIVRATEDTINGCNNEIIIPAYNISKKLVPGENIIEFTPKDTGVIPYSCWMGMIRSKITVVDSSPADTASSSAEVNALEENVSSDSASTASNGQTGITPAVGGCCGV